MFSYLNPQPTTSSSPLTETEARSRLIALPSAMVRGQRRTNRKGRGRNSRAITSKAYNAVASRPISQIVVRPQIYTATARATFASFLSTSTVAVITTATSFYTTQFSQFSEYLGLFDQYRFDEIEVWIEPIQSQSVTSTNTGEYATSVDLDDANQPSNYAAVEGRQNSIVTTGLAGHYHKWVPHMAVAAYSGTFTSFSNADPEWIDSGSPSVQHYGIKMATNPTAAVMVYCLTVRAKVSFRNSGI